ncbi:winged helix-turn-helix transcriptional regulator [Nocardia sp. 2]|uniref:Winged helix-turn-helix transcriptional regulator n=1 Tax=Nocardia acididurans TaxID=2802282 RepID=A0ABS1MGI2_9NOCA|nr:metalloregulator ArsR/SmtB family transcription factor [Nocardia acididurans]MBL1079371.1 winged helix-turn-helix transcriptional regulator [Nocardia acididurans]
MRYAFGVDEVAAAIADPVRREILLALHAGTLTAGDIAELFPISRPAVSRHLRVLRESGLVRDELVGRQRFYHLEAGPLREIADWLAQFESHRGWEAHLDALETEVYRTRRERRTRPAGPGSAKENTA